MSHRPLHELPARQARIGLASIFGSTFLELTGYFMLAPWLLLRLKDAELPTWLAGLFAATAWAGIFLVTPFASAVTRRLGRRPTLWLSGLLPVLAGLVFSLSDALGLWFGMQLLAGFVGGFFESGLTAILPLYGLALGLGAAAAALLVSASGLGSSLLMLPAGLLADRLGRGAPGSFWGGARQTRLQLMRIFATITLLGSGLLPWVADQPVLAWPLAFVWGGAGGCLYTLSMIDIGSRERGITLVNSTSVLVLAYTLGGVLAPALGAAALQWSPRLGFPALLIAVAAAGLVMLLRARLSAQV